MAKLNYALIIGIVVVAAAIAIPVILGVTQGTKVHIDEGLPIEKNITLFAHVLSGGNNTLIDADGIEYYTSAQVASRIVTGKNYTVSVLTVNNHTGYWISTFTEIKPSVNKTRAK